MHYYFRHKAQGTRHKQTYVLNLSNNPIRRVFTQNLFISSKLSLKSPKTALLVLALLLLSSSWNVQANSKKVRAGNRSDAIIMLSPVIDYVRPALSSGDGRFAGPVDIWDPDHGFLVKPADRSSYDLNFPTTGAHNLYFDLLITGIEPEELTWEPVTHEGITATVTNVVAEDWWIPDGDRGVVARVKLTGPEARNQWKNPHPSPIVKPRLPQTFELVGRDRKGNEVIKYGFVLKQWFVLRVNGDRDYSDHLAWCRSLGYSMPRVRDLTNAKCGVDGRDFPCVNNIDGATPSSSGDHYKRHIGAGFFTEWGYVSSYRDAYCCGYSFFWTSDATGSSDFLIDSSGLTGSSHFLIDSDNGSVINSKPSNSRNVLCTAP
ncbi:hypothetical protein [Gilliamella intestini]|uniref:Uncharacterized protein n=1 Tax=Gilliamella intestini TaxID=1798183 RepID=A0A1C4BTS4_9GAMM|nr:hypothetical protein [Gilliamella intestini]SCC10152.1 hypothetical protein GA0061080_10257 [Gilliamella intestini]